VAGEQHGAEARNGPRWPLWTRLIVAAPGIATAALVIAGGIYLTVTGVLFFRSLPAGDDFASLASAAVFTGVASAVFGLLLAAASLVVSLRRPRRLLLVLAALVACSEAVLAAYLLGTGADRIVYVPLVAVPVYLASVAVLRLLLTRRVANTSQAHRADSASASLM
jgi:hypothetical protein